MQLVQLTCATALLAALTWTIGPGTALATCTIGPIGFTVWPTADATDVPVDTPIVVGRYYVGGDTNIIQTSLSTADGTDVPLEELSRLPPPWRGCGASEHLFLRPLRKLDAGEKYTLTITSGVKGPVSRSAFTVGEGVAVADSNVDPAITYLKVSRRPECLHEACEDYAKLLIELAGPPSRPLWLRVQGSHPAQNANAWTFFPMGWSAQQDAQPELLSEIQLSVPLAAGDSCVDIQIYGVEGRRLFDERRCQPDRCAVYGILAATNSGGGPGGSPVDVKQVADGSCDDPPVLQDGAGGIRYPHATDSEKEQSNLDAGHESYTDDATVPMRRAAVAAANGCSVSRAEELDNSVARLFTTLLLPMLIVSSRRFVRKKGYLSSMKSLRS